MIGARDLSAVTARLAAAFRAVGVEYASGGSVASSLYGEPRATRDLDVAVRLQEAQIAALLAALGPDFSVDEEALRAATRALRSCTRVFLQSFAKIVLFVRGRGPYDEAEFSRVVEV